MKQKMKLIIGVVLGLLTAIGMFVMAKTSNNTSQKNTSTTIKSASYKVELNKRMEILKYGVGFGEIFRDPFDFSPKWFNNFIGDEDIKLLKQYGVKHVRLAIHPGFLIDKKQKTYLSGTYMTYIDNLTRKFLKNKIAVVLDFHDTDSDNYEKDGYFNDIKVVWSSFAKHFSKYDSNYVYFETLNEPWYQDTRELRYTQQKEIIDIIRKQAPNHTIIATASYGGSLERLIEFKPYEDKNVVYTFHFYNPSIFTHQGANRGSQSKIKGLKYPFSYDECTKQLINYESGTDLYNEMQRYCDQKDGNKKMLRNQIKQVYDWSIKNKVKVYVGEFGVYNETTDIQSRKNWYKDIMPILKEFKFGRAIWGYTNGFGFGAIKDEKTYKIKSYDKEIVNIVFGKNIK